MVFDKPREILMRCRFLFLVVFILTVICSNMAGAENFLGHDHIARIGQKIFANECSLKEECLVHWNVGEDFLSLGIGHFIWYPKASQGPFDETFPAFVRFAKDKQTPIPSWLDQGGVPFCPWSSREEFLASQQDPRLVELRDFLAQTKLIQVEFIIDRFRKLVPILLEGLSRQDQQRVRRRIDHLFKTPRGIFALIDYSHFKGFGIKESERYQGQGWGLIQVLSRMRLEDEAPDALEEFIIQAMHVLHERVQNAPQERNEQRWLVGWHNRVRSYRNP
jgi:hypothetical protein